MEREIASKQLTPGSRTDTLDAGLNLCEIAGVRHEAFTDQS